MSVLYLQFVHSPGQNYGIFNLRRSDVLVEDRLGSDNSALCCGLFSVI